MIDWWGLFYNTLWVLGLAVGLAALSMAVYRARTTPAPLRRELDAPSFRLPLDLGMTLFCLGLLFAARHWWERVLWGLLVLLFAGQGVLLWRNRPRPAPPRRRAEAGRRAAGGRSSSRLAWGLILLGLLILLIGLVVIGLQLLGHARSLQSHLRQLEQMAADPAALDAAGQHLGGMRRDLEAIQSLAGPLLPATRLLGWLPTYGGDLAAAPDLLDLAVAVSAAGDRTFWALAPALDLLDDPAAEKSVGERLLPVLIAAGPELQAARRDLDAAQEARQRIDPETLSPRVAGLLDRLDRYLPLFDAALDGALLAPDLLGADGPRTYLILAQNSYELRPTGGFISSVAELTVDRGRLGDMQFSDSYRVDNYKVPHDFTPLDLQRTLYGEMWLFRDANWDPDFPTSARKALQIYANDRGVRADGVIALDLSALEALVDALAPLTVEGIEEPVTGENVLRLIEEGWNAAYARREELGHRWQRERKSVMGQIAGAALDKVLGGDVSPVPLLWAVKQALDEKHILIYMDDPQVAALLRRQNWDGALVAPAIGDALLVVDSNVGFNKVDANVSRAIRYRVDLSAADGPQAQLTLTYRNHSRRQIDQCIQEWKLGDTYQDLKERCYWDYVRVYVPAGSRLLRGPDLPLPPGSLLARMEVNPPDPPVSPTMHLKDWEVWTSFFALEPQATLTLTFEYALPERVLVAQPKGATAYRLRVQKQPGTVAIPLRVEIALPPGAKALAAEPPDLPSASTDLRTDRTFLFVFQQ